MITTDEIFKAVERAMEYHPKAIDKPSRKNGIFARYIGVLMMHEEGYLQKEIAAEFGLTRFGIREILLKCDSLLSTSREFKKTYLACIKSLADNEENTDMTLKLNPTQLEAIHALMRDFVMPVKPTDVAEKLVYNLMVKVFKKLRAKVEAKIKDSYSITLTDEEAMAYYVYFNQRSLHSDQVYEAAIIRSHIAELDLKYA